VALVQCKSSGMCLLKNVYGIISWICQETFLLYVNGHYTNYATQRERCNSFRYCVIMCVTAVCFVCVFYVFVCFMCVFYVCLFYVCSMFVCVLHV
jgi:hypothetical protein